MDRRVVTSLAYPLLSFLLLADGESHNISKDEKRVYVHIRQGEYHLLVRPYEPALRCYEDSNPCAFIQPDDDTVTYHIVSLDFVEKRGWTPEAEGIYEIE